MKKTTKIILSICAGLLVVGCVGAPLVFGAKKGVISGGIFNDVNEAWNKTKVNIGLDETWKDKCYSGEDGDYIDNISFSQLDDSYWGDGALCISYGLYFNVFDDLEVYFVFDNGYTTSVITSHFLVGGESFEISPTIAQENNLYTAHITEVHVRTID